MHRLPVLLPLLLLAGCGQKGPLYEPDAGVAVTPQSSPAAPTAPASPDRSDEPRKRVPQPPSPAQSR